MGRIGRGRSLTAAQTAADVERVVAMGEQERALWQRWNAWRERLALLQAAEGQRAAGHREPALALEHLADRLPRVSRAEAVAANRELVDLLIERRSPSDPQIIEDHA